MILVYPSEATTDVGNYLSIQKLNMEFPSAKQNFSQSAEVGKDRMK